MDKKLLVLGILLIVTFIIYILFAVLRLPLFSFTQAANDNRPISLTSSLIFAWPLEVAAGTEDDSEITVFIRDAEGRGIPEKQVTLTSSLGEVQGNPSITDSQGKAVFTVSSSTIGVAEIEAMVDNRKLQNNVSVKFE